MGRQRVAPWWADALVGPGGARRWLLELELAWYAVMLVLIVVARLAGSRPIVAVRVEYTVMVTLATLCALAALSRWWRPSWSAPIALGVTGLGILVLAVRPLGPLGPLRLMLSAAVVPVLLAAAARRADRWTAALVVVLACLGAGIDVARGGNTLSTDLAARLIGANPSRPLVLVTGVLLVVLPLAFGLVLRTSDTARRAELLARVRAEERLGVARELHDLVANHVTGIVVAAQAAGLSSDLPQPAARSFEAIEAAGNRALGAMQRMVGALRADHPSGAELPPAEIDGLAVRPVTALDAVRTAVGDDNQVRMHVGGDVAEHDEDPADVVMTVHRIVVESLTNARRHAPAGSRIDVELDLPCPSELTLVITNERARGPGRALGGGYGLVGLRERAAAVGGRLEAGPVGDGRWRVHAVLPC